MAWSWIRRKDPEGVFGASSTAEEVTAGADAWGLVAVVTVGTSGLGLETLKTLALRGVRVFLAARNMERAAEVRAEILLKMPAGKIDLLQIDLSSLLSVRRAAKEFLSLNIPLNLLVNNAGMTTNKFRLTEDGIEEQFATNYLGPYLFTQLLLNKMKATASECGREGRIVNLSSMAHKSSYKMGMSFKTLRTSDGYDWLASYGQSKLAVVLHTKELSKRLRDEAANVTINSVDPGAISTNLLREVGTAIKLFSAVYVGLLGKDISRGAATQCYVSLNPAVNGVSGEYFEDCKVSTPSAFALDSELAKKLIKYLSDRVAYESQPTFIGGNLAMIHYSEATCFLEKGE
ncbi:hypothetical protein R1sor_025119 [Riccia sorocarpa]|uniref:Uncharacterized protein n=1 Tax=Riccia sorocarpa TaxID=122646 RepID=A0ABD3G920_9MARC